MRGKNCSAILVYFYNFRKEEEEEEEGEAMGEKRINKAEIHKTRQQ